MTEDKIINHMMELKDDQVEIEEEDLIEEVNLHEEKHGTAEKAFGMVIASNGEMYFENNTFLNRSLLSRLNKK
ncbi:MAG: hypothetical protein PVF56_09685 [Desulfobacterales bacterium]